MERRAEDAERRTGEALLLQYVARHSKQTMDGLITSVRAHGFVVELVGMGISGFAYAGSLPNDHYRLGQDRLRLVGSRSRRTYGLGDRVRVRVKRVDFARGELELTPVGSTASQERKSKKQEKEKRRPSRGKKERRG